MQNALKHFRFVHSVEGTSQRRPSLPHAIVRPHRASMMILLLIETMSKRRVRGHFLCLIFAIKPVLSASMTTICDRCLTPNQKWKTLQMLTIERNSKSSQWTNRPYPHRIDWIVRCRVKSLLITKQSSIWCVACIRPICGMLTLNWRMAMTPIHATENNPARAAPVITAMNGNFYKSINPKSRLSKMWTNTFCFLCFILCFVNDECLWN